MKPQIVIIIFLCIVIQAANAYSLPQFPIRFGDGISGEHDHLHEVEAMTMDCRTCHLNPTGGGSITSSPLNSGNIAPNGTFSHTFDTAGTYYYVCTISGHLMRGTVIVE